MYTQRRHWFNFVALITYKFSAFEYLLADLTDKSAFGIVVEICFMVFQGYERLILCCCIYLFCFQVQVS